MNILTLKREIFDDDFTLGTLIGPDAKFYGCTVEDTDRRLEDGSEKVYGKTAIPRGRYRVTLSYSYRFKKVLPQILDVPQFSGVRIHGGNSADDSLGCIILGRIRTSNGVRDCAGALAELIKDLEVGIWWIDII